MKLRNLSQKEFGVLTGIPQTSISNIERNKTSPNIARLFKLAKALKIPITEFIEEKTLAETFLLLADVATGTDEAGHNAIILNRDLSRRDSF